ncbi:MAG: hypothetical protein IJR54_01180 [Oscillibacter sp.]|nr:hypothetical protein [Oscillibacter sp.]
MVKISNSAVSMAASHEYESRVLEEQTSLTFNDRAVEESFTPIRARMDSFERSVTLRESEERTGNAIRTASAEVSEQRASVIVPGSESAGNGSAVGGVPDIRGNLEDLKASVLRKMLELLRDIKDRKPLDFGELSKGRVLDLRTSSYKLADLRVQLFNTDAEALPRAETTSAGTVWRKVTSTSVTRSEYESTTFRSQGLAVTEDGRALHFDVDFSMSRSFTANYESVKSESVIMTDPLMITLDNHPPSLRDAKFSFDLDGDGETENISFAGDGSGFLALDVNGNGVIDDGSELFGTKSGDGFADLAAYDEDGNGWIDENDAVFDKLRVWTKDTEGADRLTGLKEANVGAIYLDSARTEFSLNNAVTNETNGVIRRTGVYLKETGEAGTLSHVDLRR